MQKTGTELNITGHQLHKLHGKEWRWFVLHLVPAVLLPVTLTTQNKHQQLSGYTAVVKTTALAFLQHTSIAERHTYIQSQDTYTIYPSTARVVMTVNYRQENSNRGQKDNMHTHGQCVPGQYLYCQPKHSF